MGTIVVGVDGSESAERALRWAVEEGRLRGATVEAVLVYPPPGLPSYYAPYAGEAVLPAPSEEEREEVVTQAEAALLRSVEAVTGPEERDSVRRIAVCDYNPAEALIRLSKDADLLVVGTRGLGGFKGLVLGSISTKIVHHAECTVVVVHDPE